MLPPELKRYSVFLCPSIFFAAQPKIWDVDRNIPITQVRTMEDVIETAIAQPRYNALLLALFAGIALCLGAIGIYGVISYAVTQRTREIGIRIALGAQQRDVLSLVVREGMTLASIGVGIGLLAAFALTRWMETMLFGVRPSDPLTLAVIALLVLAGSFLGFFVPAPRAAEGGSFVCFEK